MRALFISGQYFSRLLIFNFNNVGYKEWSVEFACSPQFRVREEHASELIFLGENFLYQARCQTVKGEVTQTGN